MQPADQDSRLAAVLLAVHPAGLKGAVVRGRSAMLCEQWLAGYNAAMPAGAPFRRLPSNITEERLLGGLDFASTLSRGVAVCERGVLANADGGTVLLQVATTRPGTLLHTFRALDAGQVQVERDGFSERHRSTFVAVVLECGDDEFAPPSVTDRVAFLVTLGDGIRDAFVQLPDGPTLAAARARLPGVTHSDATVEALTTAAAQLGITSVRVILLALQTARAHAALHGRPRLLDEDLAMAGRLVFAPRAVALASGDTDADRHPADEDVPPAAEPAPRDELQGPSPHDAVPKAEPAADQRQDTAADTNELRTMVVRAVNAALPAGLLATVAARAAASHAGSNTAGRAGKEESGSVRGRQIGTRRGDPRGGARLDLVATLRAAVPMQRVRRASKSAPHKVVELRRSDFRVRRCSSPGMSTTLFLVDASGSAAIHRLAEAKGAIELMLAEGYARRDRVAVIAFRGTTAELVLPATHALARARRAIAGMPAGGGTPLATALDLAAKVSQQLRRDSSQVVTIVLTDGRANVARDGRGGRARAEADALDAARRYRTLGGAVVWIDTSARSDAPSRQLAECAGARYILLPAPTATTVSAAAHTARTSHVPATSDSAMRAASCAPERSELAHG